MNAQEFDIDIDEGQTVIEIKHSIQKKQSSPDKVEAMRLIFGSEILDDACIISDTAVKDGDSVTLVKRRAWPIMELLVNIYDDTQWHGRHKFALRSQPLGGEVEKIDVTVRRFADQGWGGC